MRNHRKNVSLSLLRLKFLPALTVLLVFIAFFNILTLSLFAQDSPPRAPETPDMIIERIRLYYGLKQYQQVLLECYKLERASPENRMMSYYKTMAETRLKEMGLPIPTPIEVPPVATPHISPVSPTPTFAAPERTKAPDFPSFPGTPPPDQTSEPVSFSPFVSKPPTDQTPLPDIATETPAISPPDSSVEQPYFGDEQDMAPARGSLEKFMNYRETNLPLFFGMLAIFLALFVLIVLLIVIFIRKTLLKRKILKLEKLTSKAQEKMAEPLHVKKEDTPQGQPQAPGEFEGFDFNAPDFPTIESYDDQFAPPPLPGEELTELPQSSAPDLPEPADIPSPSTFDQISLQPDSEPGLPDIPSPTAPPLPALHGASDDEPEFPKLPSDLPTFEEISDAAQGQTPTPTFSAEEIELPAFSLDNEEPRQELSPIESHPSFESPLSIDPPAAEESPPASPVSIEDLLLDSSAEPSEKDQEGDFKDENLLTSPLPRPKGEEKPPAISIEDAFGFGESSQDSPDKVMFPATDRAPLFSKDAGSTSMDIDEFLFAGGGEENSETMLDLDAKREQEKPDSSEPLSIEPIKDRDARKDDFRDVIFDEKSLAETKIRKPASAPLADISRESEESPSFTTKRMENILPFDKEERENSGNMLSNKRPDRNETLFQEQFQKGRSAFEQGDWKKAVYYLTVASAIKPDAQDLKDMLSLAREKKRSEQ